MFINFSDLPGHSNLFLDYLNEFDNLSHFFNLNFRDNTKFVSQFQSISNFNREHRSELSKIVRKQYEGVEISPKTEKNISLLAEQNTITIVTGQQLGILGGPLYTIYKAITAIKLARYLNEKYTRFNFLSLFWMESEDHDFEEISSISFIDENNNLQLVTYNDNLPVEENRGSTGNIKLKDSINEFIVEINKLLRQSDFKEKNLQLINDCYKPGVTFKYSFKKLLLHLFDIYGLIIFDPQDVEVKNILKPIFKNEILNFRKHSEKLIQVSAELEELYHAQVKVRAVNLFMNYEGGRYLIEPVEENSFRLKNKRVRFSEDELLKLVDDKPESFSPNVLLRPICQDYLFPTGFYVAGPGEIAYFAQVMPLYKFYDIPEPIIYPRSSATIIEKNISSVLAKYRLTLPDFFIDNEKVIVKLIKNLSSVGVEDMFLNFSKDIDNSMLKLKTELSEIDKSIADSSERYKQKIYSSIEDFRNKALEAEKRKYESAIRQTNRVLVNVYPNSVLQERELNYFAFSNKYGMDFINFVFTQLEINKFEHQIIEL
jgi:bacillithiol biosynthesis cysteine-adding enzyme BshC